MNKIIIILLFICFISKSQVAFYNDSLLINDDSLVYIENYKEIGITTVTDDSVIFRNQLGGGVYFDTDESLIYTFTIRGDVGNSTEIFWGDNSSTLITYTGIYQVITHNYSGADGLKNVFFRNQNFSYLTVNTQNLEGNLSNEFLSSFYLYLYNIPLLTGDISNYNPSYYLYLYNIPLLTGDVSNFNPSYQLVLYNIPLLTGDASNYNPSYYLYLYNIPLLTGDVSNFNPSYYLVLYNIPLLTGDASNFNPSYYLLLYNIPLLTGDASNFNPSYQLYLRNIPLLTGDASNFNPSYYLLLLNIPLLTGDISNYNPSYFLYLYNIPLITINSAMIFQYSCKLITVQNCSLLTSEVDRIIQRAYDNGNTGGTLEIRGNTAPSATGLSQIATMRNDRGWTINHD
jgi:hypothetical protein